MENASKALIIVGAVLIAITIISLGLLLYTNLRQTTDDYTTRLDTVETQKYNSSFEPFLGRKNITIQEIITVYGVAKQKELGTKVFLKTLSDSQKEITAEWTQEDENKALSEYIYFSNAGNEKNLFECTEIKYFENEKADNGKVSEIYFKQIK